MRHRQILSAALWLLGGADGAPAAREEPPSDTYDYVVIGSGPGGGPLACNLARAGYSTLLLEAGSDQSDDLSTVIANAYFPHTSNARLTWGFFVKHFSDMTATLKHNHLTWKFPNGTYWVGNGEDAPEEAELMGVLYPRGATLGGSSITNAMATWLPSDSDWDNIVDITGDTSWNHEHMRNIFTRIEHSNYLPNGTTGHGTTGYYETNMGDGSQYKLVPGTLEVMKAEVKTLGDDPDKVLEYLGRDGNYVGPDRDQDTGLYGLPFHATAGWERWSSRTYILDTLNAENEDGSRKYPLTVSTNSLATRLIWENDKDTKRKRGTPRVEGVEYLKGESMYEADARHDPGEKGQSMKAYAKRDVVVSGGTFNSPQILQLSGIGDAEHLAKLGIDVKVHLPGVGANLMDNQEVPIVGRAKKNFTTIAMAGDPVCKPAQPGDPCLELLHQGEGPYSRQSANGNALLLKTRHAVWDERDVFIFTMPTPFRGFWPAVAQLELFDPPNTMGMSMVKIHPQNHKGYVRVTSDDPRQQPEINFEYYAEGAETDIGALQDAVAFGRKAFGDVAAPYGPMDVAEPPCSGEAKAGPCEGEDADWIKHQTFGHHATGTCKMGPPKDAMAVVDSDFKVHGVDGLRVVDASVFPESPGPFPVVATFMISEKATEAIVAEEMRRL